MDTKKNMENVFFNWVGSIVSTEYLEQMDLNDSKIQKIYKEVHTISPPSVRVSKWCA